MNRRTALIALSATALSAWASQLAVRAAVADDTIELQRARVEIAPVVDAFVLTADFNVTLTERLADAVNRGLPLYFRVEVAISRPRWYWWDQKTADAVIVYRLAYHALTRQYRLVQNGDQQSFATLPEALEAMSQIRGWAIAPRARLKPEEIYHTSLRMRLDTSQLPKPFQISALTNRDWNPQSEWKRFAYKPPTPTTSAP